jgi:hypothetical protein
MTSMAALAGTRTVAAQDATPTNNSSSQKILMDYFNDVIRDGNLDAIPDYFNDTFFDLDAVTWEHADL